MTYRDSVEREEKRVHPPPRGGAQRCAEGARGEIQGKSERHQERKGFEKEA